jgi:hypothetical protein
MLVALAAVLAATGCTGEPKASKRECVKQVSEEGKTGGCLPVADRTKRVDLATPTFSNPTKITNPLHPTSAVAQTIYGGQVGGKPFRTEVTLLPETKLIKWKGRTIKAVTSQYFAFSDGRIEEVALDWYAQADDGSVWYLGEDVFNYEAGRLKDTKGTWVTGKQAPPAMIMPAHPKVGTVYRTENNPPTVFEEVTVKSVGKTVEGPTGPIDSTITVRELHLDSSTELKIFAPGYGEYSTGSPDGELEQASFALPTNAQTGPVPAGVTALGKAIRRTSGAVSAKDWGAAKTAAEAVSRAWAEGQPKGVPLKLLKRQIGRDVESLSTAVGKHDADRARGALLRLSQDELDVRSLYQPVATTDLARFKLWLRQVSIDAAAKDAAGVAGDAESLRWTYQRVGPALDPAQRDQVARRLAELRTAAEKKNLAGASASAGKLSELLG